MKKILVPCDFSDHSENALRYATRLASKFGSHMVLLNVSQYPVMHPEIGLSAYTYQDAQKDSLAGLEKLAAGLRTEGIRQVQCFAEMGDIADEILRYIDEQDVDLTVMGISNHGSRLLQSLVGSNAVAVSKRSSHTVMTIPPGYTYKEPKSIALASEYVEKLNPELVFKAKQFASLFGADLHILHVVPEKHPLHTEVLVDSYSEHKMETTIHRTFIVSEKHAAKGLLSVLNSNLADVLMVEPKKHSIIHKLFHSSITTELVFNSPVPVVAVHG